MIKSAPTLQDRISQLRSQIFDVCSSNTSDWYSKAFGYILDGHGLKRRYGSNAGIGGLIDSLCEPVMDRLTREVGEVISSGKKDWYYQAIRCVERGELVHRYTLITNLTRIYEPIVNELERQADELEKRANKSSYAKAYDLLNRALVLARKYSSDKASVLTQRMRDVKPMFDSFSYIGTVAGLMNPKTREQIESEIAEALKKLGMDPKILGINPK